MRKYFLISERLGFSHWKEDDLSFATRLWGDPEVTRFLVSNGKMALEEVRGRLELEMVNYRVYGIQYWPIFLKSDDEFVGCCGFRPHGDDSHVLEMGVHLVKDQWGKGVATEACQAVIEYAFDHLQVKSLFAGHNPRNLSSARMIRGLGFIYVNDEFYPSTGLMHPSYRLEKKDCQQR
jgi:[ribosomal protein S5]-alanine N-acetyltransferase